ncbi:hypothetical protein BCR44DRAFT_1414734 [Catenaria anguillulae PL171]|uniref:Intraflagellar transport protein 52 n=1 Tax=Catenaria anguillulae PL171 TaxID=765915 RepID=A0A1Y2HQG9_9FUNG|nr:hypothetical protein BCR44DRAFT_1414734 [Catenaria anguillulae PL171]
MSPLSHAASNHSASSSAIGIGGLAGYTNGHTPNAGVGSGRGRVAAAALVAVAGGNIKSLPLILFDAAKNESHMPTTNLKLLTRKLRTAFKVAINKDELSLNRIFEASLLVFAGPSNVFSSGEFSALKSYLDIGGSILYLSSEGGEIAASTNFNYLLEEFGMSVNSDVVARTSYSSKFFHPKEAVISEGILNREFTRLVSAAAPSQKPAQYSTADFQRGDNKSGFNSQGPSFVFPYGATLNVQKPSIPIFSTGLMCYPVNRPVGGLYAHPNGKGKLAVVTSVDMLSDQYLDKEDNSRIVSVLIDWLTSDSVQLNNIDANEPELGDYHYLPDMSSLASQPRVCLQDTEEIPKHFTRLFDTSLFSLDLSLVPSALQAMNDLRLKHEPLTLIAPQFESPLPALTPAVFPPMLRELPPPPLELFDLDAHLAPPALRMEQLATKCQDEDLEYYLREAGSVLGIERRLPDKGKEGANGEISGGVGTGVDLARFVLDHAFRKIVSWKQMSQ